MKGWGGVLMAIGGVSAPGSLVMKTSISTTAPSALGYGLTSTSEVTNLSLLQLQELIFIGACALFVAGAVLFGAGVIEDAVMRAGGFRRRSAEITSPLAEVTSGGSDSDTITSYAEVAEPGQSGDYTTLVVGGVIMLVVAILLYVLGTNA